MATRSIHEGLVPSPSPHPYEVRLLGGFDLRRDGGTIEVAPSSQRVIAFLALNDRPLPRAFVAETLWPETTDDKAAANLRTALWRLHGAGHDVVDVANSHIGLRPDVTVDVRIVDRAARLLRLRGEMPGPELVDTVRGELLPGCWDSWLVFERERVRVEVIHLFECLGHAALDRGDRHLAVLAGLAAVECDPLRDSANALLIAASVAGGDHRGAMGAYRRYEALLAAELGLTPSDDIRRLIGGCLTPR